MRWFLILFLLGCVSKEKISYKEWDAYERREHCDEAVFEYFIGYDKEEVEFLFEKANDLYIQGRSDGYILIECYKLFKERGLWR